MKTVTYEEFLKFKPCWLKYEDGAERIKAYFDRFGGSMSALDILNLNDVSKADKLWSVLREEFIPASMLHEFACVCAEYALSLIDNPDPRSIKAIEVKRAWIRGEATNEELNTAKHAAWEVFDDAMVATRDAYDATRAAKAAVWNAVSVAAWKAARIAAYEAARYAAWNAAKAAACKVGKAVAWNAGCAAYWNAVRNVREAQVAYLIMVLEEEK